MVKFFFADSKSWRAAEFQSYGDFAECMDFAYWWSFSGGGFVIKGAYPVYFIEGQLYGWHRAEKMCHISLTTNCIAVIDLRRSAIFPWHLIVWLPQIWEGVPYFLEGQLYGCHRAEKVFNIYLKDNCLTTIKPIRCAIFPWRPTLLLP